MTPQPPPYLLELRFRYSNTNNDQLPPTMALDKMLLDKPPNDVSGPARGIQSDEPFPLLDLPKDIRLMVYENLPTKLTHYHGDEGLTLAYRTIPGISILATCREINDEANAIIMPWLAIIKSKPVQLIISPWVLGDEVKTFLGCLSASEVNCPLSKDLHKLIRVANYHFNGEELPSYHDHTNIRNAQARQVCVAGYQQKPFANDPWEGAWDQLLELRNVQFLVGGICDSKLARDLIVKVRRVLITPKATEEQVEIDKSRADPVPVSRYPGITSPLLSEGTPIEEAEWDQDWAEGER